LRSIVICIGGASIAALEKRKTSVHIQPDAADSIARVKTRKFALVVMVIYIVSAFNQPKGVAVKGGIIEQKEGLRSEVRSNFKVYNWSRRE
jgi:hypothetical protein